VVPHAPQNFASGLSAAPHVPQLRDAAPGCATARTGAARTGAASARDVATPAIAVIALVVDPADVVGVPALGVGARRQDLGPRRAAALGA
jgi:hypothetical protein